MSASKNVTRVDMLYCDKLVKLNSIFEAENKLTLGTAEVVESGLSRVIDKGF